MSRLNVKDNSTYGNVNTHIFTEFSTLAKETTQKEVLEAIKGIDINVGEIVVGDITVESSDTVTHEKLDVLTSAVINKHLNSGFDSIEIGSVATGITLPVSVDNFPTSFEISNLPSVQVVSGEVSVSNMITGYATQQSLLDNITAVNNVNTSLVNKHLDKTTDSVDISGQSVSVSNMITGFALDSTLTTTNTKLDTINTTITDKHLSSATDSISVSGAVNVDKVVEPIIYNLNYVGTAMYADSINGAIVDNYGRAGWWWTNSTTTGGSNCYWYSNSIVPQNQMTKEQLDCVFVILALDRVSPNIVLPFVPMYSAPTGSGDIIPTFAHSSWTYTIPADSKLNAGEVIMLTIGDSSKVATIRPELRRISLTLNSSAGQALPTENIAYISLNTDSGLKDVNGIQYLLQYAGFHYSVTDKIVEYEFNNGVQKVINDNLTNDGIKISNTVDIDGSVDVNNFPTSFQVSNFPSSFEVSNFPTSFEVSNTVTIYDANTEAINQKLTSAAAPNNDCIKVFQANNPTSIEVSNFPATQAVSGSVSVSNLPVTQQVSGSVSVLNFPVSQEVTGDFYPATQPVSGSVTVNTISGFALESGGNLASIKSKTDLLHADTTNADAIQVQVKNSSIPVTGTFYQATQPVSGTVAVSNSFTLDTTTQSTNTKLDTIHADLDGLTFDGSSNLNVNVAAGSISVSSVNIKDSSGNNLNSTSNALNNYITNSSLDTHMYASSNGSNWHHLSSDSNGQLNIHSKTQDGAGVDITSTLNGSKQSLDVNVSNTVPVTGTFYPVTQQVSGSVSVSNFPATQPVSISSNLNVNMNDFAGNSITSDTFSFNGNPKNGLDVAVINNSSNPIPVSGTFYPATQPVSGTFWQATQPVSGIVTSNIKSSNGTDITATAFPLKTGLDVNVCNASIPVTGTFWQETQPISGTIDSNIRSTSGFAIGATASSLHTYDYNISTAFNNIADCIGVVNKAKSGSNYYELSCDTSGIQNVNVVSNVVATDTTTYNTCLAYSTSGTAQVLQITPTNDAQFSLITGIAGAVVFVPPTRSVAKACYVLGTAGVSIWVRVYAINTSGAESIFYCQISGTTQITTGYVNGPSATGPTVNLSTDLIWINNVFIMSSLNSGSIYARQSNNGIVLNMVEVNNFYKLTPFYMVPSSKKAYFYGWDTIANNIAGSYSFLCYKYDSTQNTYAVSFPFRTSVGVVSSSTSQYAYARPITKLEAGDLVAVYKESGSSTSTQFGFSLEIKNA